jgi:uncharacterized membrane protein
MVKLVGALASLFLGNYLSHTKPTSVLVMDYLASKSRLIILMTMACITLSILFTAGVVLSILGTSGWINAVSDETLANAQFICYSGIGLILFSAVTTYAIFEKSKSALELKQPEEPKPEHPIQAVIVSLIQDLAREKVKESEEAQKEDLESEIPPTATHPRKRGQPVAHRVSVKAIDSH